METKRPFHRETYEPDHGNLYEVTYFVDRVGLTCTLTIETHSTFHVTLLFADKPIPWPAIKPVSDDIERIIDERRALFKRNVSEAARAQGPATKDAVLDILGSFLDGLSK